MVKLVKQKTARICEDTIKFQRAVGEKCRCRKVFTSLSLPINQKCYNELDFVHLFKNLLYYKLSVYLKVTQYKHTMHMLAQ